MKRFGRFLVRLTAFFRKEIAEVLRQPKLILTLIFGPFLIMLLFGMGYKNDARPMRTLFVAPENSPIAAEIEKRGADISPLVIYSGITNSEDEMRRQLAARQVDMAIVVPGDAYETIKNNQKAVFQVYHNELDPVQISYVTSISQIFTDEINRQVLSSVAAQGQSDAASLENYIDNALTRTREVRSALESGDQEQARASQTNLKRDLSAIDLAVGASLGLLSGVEQNISGTNQSGSIMQILNESETNPAVSGEVNDANKSQQIEGANKLETDLQTVKTQLAEFQSISPSVLTQPFIAETKTISNVEFDPMSFFTPGVVVLLLQHITITLAALSIVRERRSGTMELYRVSPIRPSEVLFGKFMSYSLIGIFIAAALGLLLAYVLKVPMLGSWINAGLVVLALLFASMGVGFLISLMAGTESQAVQFAMIALLFSVFFSGFILDLRYLFGPVQFISWIIPATYGTILLQNIMLRGLAIAMPYMINLLIIGAVTFFLAWLFLRHQMSHE